MAGLVSRGLEYMNDRSLLIRSMPDVRNRLKMYQNKACIMSAAGNELVADYIAHQPGYPLYQNR